MVNIVFHLKSNEGHIERFSFDVYMPPLPIFTKIKHPFAWHITFLVRHLRKYSEMTGFFITWMTNNNKKEETRLTILPKGPPLFFQIDWGNFLYKYILLLVILLVYVYLLTKVVRLLVHDFFKVIMFLCYFLWFTIIKLK